MNKKKGMTVGDTRIYICKDCGTETQEPLRKWKSKSQRVKNICHGCLASRRLKKQTAMERSMDEGYKYLI